MKKLTCTDVVGTLKEYKGRSNDASVAGRIDDVCDIVAMMSDEEVNKVDSLISLVEKIDKDRFSRLDNIENSLDAIYDELKEWIKENINPLKNKAIYSMRQKKKTSAIVAVVVLSIVAAAVLVLGVLSVFDKIDAVWSNLIGVVDCVFGLSFFIYEFCDDKLKASEITALDEEQVDNNEFGALTQNINHGIQSRGSFNKNIQITHNTYSTYNDESFTNGKKRK